MANETPTSNVMTPSQVNPGADGKLRKSLLMVAPIIVVALAVGGFFGWKAYLRAQAIREKAEYTRVYGEAIKLEQQRNYDKEIAILQAYLKTKPRNIRYTYIAEGTLGFAYASKGDKDQSAHWLKQAISRNISNPNPGDAVRLAMLYDESKDYNQAIYYYQVAIRDVKADSDPLDDQLINFYEPYIKTLEAKRDAAH